VADQRTYGSGLVRDVELLEVLARPDARDGLGVSRIAALAGRDKAQVSRALATLAEAGLVDRDPHTRAYRPGWRLFALATHATETHLARLAAPFLRTIVARLDETTHLCVLRAGRVSRSAANSPRTHFADTAGKASASTRSPLRPAACC